MRSTRSSSSSSLLDENSRPEPAAKSLLADKNPAAQPARRAFGNVANVQLVAASAKNNTLTKPVSIAPAAAAANPAPANAAGASRVPSRSNTLTSAIVLPKTAAPAGAAKAMDLSTSPAFPDAEVRQATQQQFTAAAAQMGAQSRAVRMQLESPSGSSAVVDRPGLDSATSSKSSSSPSSCPSHLDNDHLNPQLTAEYIPSIMAHLRSIETRYAPSQTYMTLQRDINYKMREILVDWLVDVHNKFKLQPQTLYLCINYLDRFLEKRAVHRSKLQLVGCAALLLASKYEEIFAPEVRDFVYISDKAYTKVEILNTEGVMLSTLNFNLTVATPLNFAERFARVSSEDSEFNALVRMFCEVPLQQYHMLKYLPSEIAAAAVLLARRTLGAPVAWPSQMSDETHYAEEYLEQCVADIKQLTTGANPKYSAVRRKFSQEKFFNVARFISEAQ